MRVGLIGAGNIAQIHREVLASINHTKFVAVVDVDQERAKQFAGKDADVSVYPDLSSLLDEANLDAVHVLVPPDKHANILSMLCKRNVATLVEKPFTANLREADDIVAADQDGSTAPLYVNHNFVFHPAFKRLRDIVEQDQLGKICAIQCNYALPLRQLSAGQYYHWMFQRPANLLLEQAVHPLSQIFDLAGFPTEVNALSGTPLSITSDQTIPTSLSLQFRSDMCNSQINLLFGATHADWQISVQCTDGTVTADIVRNRVWRHERSKWLPAIDDFLDSRKTSKALKSQAVSELVRYTASVAGLRPRSDPYFDSMRSSISSFHSNNPSAVPTVNTAMGARNLVEVCQRAAEIAFPKPGITKSAHTSIAKKPEIVVIGGGGFIGRHIVSGLANEGTNIGIVSRHASKLGNFNNFPKDVCFVDADITDPSALREAFSGVKAVVNTASPYMGNTWQETESVVRQSISALTQACLEAGVERLVHLGSSASLYLGSPKQTITGRSSLDPRPERRPIYARAKALSDLLLLMDYEETAIPVCILRPAIVVGKHGLPFHSGVGLFVNERHCIGWNKGDTPLPFVLAEDVAKAAVAATRLPNLEGRCYNLVGDVRLTAKEYIEELAHALGRPIEYYPHTTEWLWATELGKWVIKRASGRNVPVPSLRDLKSRSFLSQFDCSDAKRDLSWTPVADRSEFVQKGIAVHGTA